MSSFVATLDQILWYILPFVEAMTSPLLSFVDLASLTEEDLLTLFNSVLDKQQKVFHFDPSSCTWVLSSEEHLIATGFALTENLAMLSALANLSRPGVESRDHGYFSTEVPVRVDSVELPEDLEPSKLINIEEI